MQKRIPWAAALSAIGALIIVALQTPPETMAANVGKWLGIFRLPVFQPPPWIDEVFFVLAGALIGIGGALAFPVISRTHWKDWLAARSAKYSKTLAQTEQTDTKALSAVQEQKPASKIKAEAPYRRPEPSKDLPLKRPMLLAGEVTASGEKKGNHLVNSRTAMDIINDSPQELADCTVHFIKMLWDGQTLPINRSLMGEPMVIPTGGKRRRIWIKRDLADIETQPPHRLVTADGEFPLPENSNFQLIVELRSRYPYPTVVTLDVTTTYEYAQAKIISQTI